MEYAMVDATIVKVHHHGQDASLRSVDQIVVSELASTPHLVSSAWISTNVMPEPSAADSVTTRIE